MLLILWMIPESPRWLAAHDRPDECLAVLQRLRCNDDPVVVQQLHGAILQTVAYEESIGAGSWKDLLKNDHIKSRTRLLIACGIQSFQQLGGINAIIYYSGTLFEKSIGFSSHMSSLMSGFLQTWFFVASFIPWFLIDRIGRRPLVSFPLALTSISLTYQAPIDDQSDGNRHGRPSCIDLSSPILNSYRHFSRNRRSRHALRLSRFVLFPTSKQE